MRISLLLDREPFGQILEKTLAKYWKSIDGVDREVSWQPAYWIRKISSNQQMWYCNIYLNTLFLQNFDPAALDPLRREFSRSCSVLKRPFQSAYVSLASNPSTAPLFAHYCLLVSPAAPQNANSTIVAGNHKIRILDHQSNRSISILKYGFPEKYINAELETRQQAAELKLPIPALHDIDRDNHWFSEDYISGTPLNRLSDPLQSKNAFQSALSQLHPFIRSTEAFANPIDYIDGLLSSMVSGIASNHLLTSQEKDIYCGNVSNLAATLKRSPIAGKPLLIAQTHGDFQAANILLDSGNIWLIDWEYSARRQSCYDLFVYCLRSRSARCLSQRIESFINNPTSLGLPQDLNWPGFNWYTIEERRWAAQLFLLEEWSLHIGENANLLFTGMGPGLNQLHLETHAWFNHQGAFID